MNADNIPNLLKELEVTKQELDSVKVFTICIIHYFYLIFFSDYVFE